jgi:hypothetical protein
MLVVAAALAAGPPVTEFPCPGAVDAEPAGPGIMM